MIMIDTFLSKHYAQSTTKRESTSLSIGKDTTLLTQTFFTELHVDNKKVETNPCFTSTSP